MPTVTHRDLRNIEKEKNLNMSLIQASIATLESLHKQFTNRDHPRDGSRNTRQRRNKSLDSTRTNTFGRSGGNGKRHLNEAIGSLTQTEVLSMALAIKKNQSLLLTSD